MLVHYKSTVNWVHPKVGTTFVNPTLNWINNSTSKNIIKIKYLHLP